jgi:RimJ/RimL family protein N-acetyltransferase
MAAAVPDPATVRLVAGDFVLRPMAPADRAGIVAAGQAPSIGGRMPWFPKPFPEHYADGWIEEADRRWRAGQHYVLAVLADGVYAGSVVISPQGERAELSYWILPAHEGRGWATKSARAAMDWAREAVGVAGFFAKTRPGNGASQRVLAKLGFRSVGTAEAPRFEM